MEPSAIQHYYPRIIGLTPQSDRGEEHKWVELLVTGRDEVGGLARLATLLAERGVDLTPSGGYYVLTPGTFVWTTFADLKRSKSSAEDVLRDLKRFDFVAKAEAVEVGSVAVDKFLFPVITSGDRRGLVMDLHSLMEMEKRLTQILGSAGSVLMFEQGKAYAKEGLEYILKDVAENEPRVLLDACAAWGRTMGWGVFSNDTTKLDIDGTVIVTISEPPNSLVPNRESHFIDGLVVGGAEFALKRKVNVVLSRYDESTRSLRVVLQAPA
jgi:hypothetical protein